MRHRVPYLATSTSLKTYCSFPVITFLVAVKLPLKWNFMWSSVEISMSGCVMQRSSFRSLINPANKFIVIFKTFGEW